MTNPASEWFRSRFSLAIVSVALAAAVVWFLWASPRAGTLDHVKEQLSQDMPGPAAVASSVETNERGEAHGMVDGGGGGNRQPAEEQAAILRLVLRRGEGPGMAVVAHVHGARLAELQNRLSPYPSTPQSEAWGIDEAGVSGSLDMRVPPQQWSWLRLTTGAGRVLFHAVPPFSGVRQEEIDLGRGPVIHLRVLDASFVRPRPLAKVRLLHALLEAPGLIAPQEMAPIECDRHGEAEIAGLPRGRLVFAAGEALPGEGAPFTATVLWSGAAEGADALVVLAEPPARHEVTLTVHYDAAQLSLPAPILYLRRLDEEQERPLPMAGTLRTGLQDAVFRCPAGRYELDVLPTGSCRIEGPRCLTVTREGSLGTVVVTPVPQSTHVQLRGIGTQDHPVRVCVQPAERLREDDPDVVFLGPLHWGVAGADVQPIPEDVWLMALGRYRSFLSTRRVRLDKPVVEVDMEPATCLRLVWSGDLPAGSASPVLVALQDGFACVRPFQRRPVLTPAGQRPGLAANVVLRAVKTSLEVNVGSDRVWTRSIELNGRFMDIRMDEPDR